MEVVGHETVGNELDLLVVVFMLIGNRNEGFWSGGNDKGFGGDWRWGWREIAFEIGKEGLIVLGSSKDAAFVNTTVVDVVVAIRDIRFDDVFVGHLLVILCF